MTGATSDAANALVARAETSWRGLLAAIAGLPDDQLVTAGAAGDWSIKDVLGHIAYWEDALTASIERRERNEPDPEHGDDDFEPINQREYMARKGWALEQIRADSERAHTAVVAALGRMPDLDPDEVAGNTWEHYDEHAEAIRAWRADSSA